MKGIVKPPSDKAPKPVSTVPHLALAHHFAKLAAMHAGMALANSPDKAVSNLPRPDKVVSDIRSGSPLFRQPVIRTPNNP
jgi:hypothetical protein